MKIKQTIRNIVLAGLFIAPLAFFGFISVPNAEALKCGDTETALIACDADGKGVEGTGLWQLLLIAINILTAGVGVLALGGIIYGSVLYASAGGNPEQVKKAKTAFTNVVIGVVAFGGMFTLLNFLVPGGVFN